MDMAIMYIVTIVNGKYKKIKYWFKTLWGSSFTNLRNDNLE